MIVNAQTDFFLDLGRYLPTIEEKNPEFVDKVSDLSREVSEWTDKIPSFSEIKAIILNEEPPIDPSDIAVTTRIENSPMLSFYPEENVGIQMKDSQTVTVFGITKSKDRSHLIVMLSDLNGKELSQTSLAADSDGKFNKSVVIPKTDDSVIELSVYTGAKQYGDYQSWVYKYVYLEKNEFGAWGIKRSPVYENNKIMYEKDKSISEALKATPSIESDSPAIISIAEQITNGKESDYDKLLAIHDWVCSYIYYDVDSLSRDDIVPYSATEVVKRRRAVCLGYASLVAALCRSIDIPCNVVSGYALGVNETEMQWTEANITSSEQNHAWNEAYVDGRWVILDTTWDCKNKYVDGELAKGEEIDHLYFDANPDFFSSNHKILEYPKRR